MTEILLRVALNTKNQPNQPTNLTVQWETERAVKVILNIQYWCIDGKYRIYMVWLRNGRKMSFSESFHPFRAEPHKFYIYRQYTNIVFILQ